MPLPPDSDLLTRFLIPRAGVRGVRVHLHETWAQIRSHSDYPPAVAELLAEATAAAALFTGHIKIDGRLSIQARGRGTLRTLFAECTAAGTLRAIAQLDDADGAPPVSRDLRDLGPDAILAITIETPSAHGRDPNRYQGLVGLSADTLSGAFEDYFRQSEQLPTRLLLAVDGDAVAGLMLQKLPGDAGDEDGWDRVSALFDTLGGDELLSLDAQTLLLRLFHEDGVERLGDKPLRFACSCSHERVAGMLESLGESEATAAIIDGAARIRCEFCGRQYVFSPDEVATLFNRHAPESEAPERLQ